MISLRFFQHFGRLEARVQFSSVQSHSCFWLFATPWITTCQASLSITNCRSSLKLMFIKSLMPSNHLILCCPLLLLPSIFPSISLFQWVGSLNQAAKVLELWLQSFQWIFRADVLKDWLIWTPCSPRDSQESSPAPQFEGINSLVLSLFYCPAFTFIHDYWKNHSFDSRDLSCWTTREFPVLFGFA